MKVVIEILLIMLVLYSIYSFFEDQVRLKVYLERVGFDWFATLDARWVNVNT